MDTVKDFPTASSSYELNSQKVPCRIRNRVCRRRWVTLLFRSMTRSMRRSVVLLTIFFVCGPVSSRRYVHARASLELAVSKRLDGRSASSAHRLGIRREGCAQRLDRRWPELRRSPSHAFLRRRRHTHRESAAYVRWPHCGVRSRHGDERGRARGCAHERPHAAQADGVCPGGGRRLATRAGRDGMRRRRLRRRATVA